MIKIIHWLAPLLLVAGALAAAAEQPNIIVILSDDQGWDGLGVEMETGNTGSRHELVQTPNIARLAAAGLRCSRAYAASPVCSPTRMSLQTGLNPACTGWTKAAPVLTAEDGMRLVPPPSRRAIAAEDVTVAELLRAAGYATAHLGKWHLGGGGPEQHGYDVSDGDTGNEDAARFTDPNPVDIFGMSRRAAQFMEQCSKEGRPFYLQLSYHALHYPENALAATKAKYAGLGSPHAGRDVEIAAITEDLDTGVGMVLDTVDRLDLAGQTFVVYLSDNGSGGGKRGLAGGKGSLREGGIRIPFIVRGPGIPSGAFCGVPVTATDLFVTWCTLAGVVRPLAKDVEGGDLLPLWQGASSVVNRPNSGLLFHFPHYQGRDGPSSAIISGSLKLLRLYETGKDLLYDLSEDPREEQDLSVARPEDARRLAKLLDQRLDDCQAGLPLLNPRYDPAKAAKAVRPGRRGKADRHGAREPK